LQDDQGAHFTFDVLFSAILQAMLGGCPRMRLFFQDQASSPEGLRPGGEGENYNRRNTLKYFEDYDLRLSQRLAKIAILGQPPGD
jgi:hypothetical protein